MVPRNGSISGSTKVSLIGSGFSDLSDAWCKFGLKPVKIFEIVSNSKVVCVSPANSPGNVTVGLTMNRIDYEISATLFTYEDIVVIKDVLPSFGPTAGSTLVTIEGKDFTDSPALKCQFGNHAVDATFVTTEKVLCKSPQRAAGVTTIKLTTNDQDFGYNEFSFSYFDMLSVSHVWPLHGPSQGGSVLTVSGAGFQAPITLQCAFVPPQNMDSLISRWDADHFQGMQTSLTKFVSSTAVACVVPPNPPMTFTLVLSKPSESIPLYNNSFHYYVDPVVTQIRPTEASNSRNTVITIVGVNFHVSSFAACNESARLNFTTSSPNFLIILAIPAVLTVILSEAIFKPSSPVIFAIAPNTFL